MAGQFDLPQLMELIAQSLIDNVYTSIPAKIIAYDYKTQKASVQPLIKQRDRDADNNTKGLADMALIQGVPVIFPSAAKGILSFPVMVGDTVMLNFSCRSIDKFVGGDGSKPVDPKDYRTHSYNDCFAVVGLYPFQKALGSHPSDVVLRANVGTANEVKLSLKPNGDLVIDSPTKVIVNATNEVEVNTQTAIVNASTSVTIDSPQTTCTGELRVDGGVSVGNDVITDLHVSLNTHTSIGNLGRPTAPPTPT